ncbi:hypothetical protein ACRPLG_02775 [Bacillus safensis]|uniref:hypothetical protein n=1 Tax=Bacillus safensis TaxID=561879 RepID=UPI003D77FE5A
MTLDITGCFKLAENVYVSGSTSRNIRKSLGDKASEILTHIHESYAAERVAIESFDDFSLCVYTYRINAQDSKIMTQQLPGYVGEDGSLSIVVWETEVIRP